MIIELEDGLKSLLFGYVSHMLMAYLLPLCLMWVGINLYFISNQMPIKLDQLKC
jgi:hypothetical protein